MNKTLVLTVVGDDRPGLMKVLSDTVSEQGGNWLASHMANLAGQFAGIVEIEIPDSHSAALLSALQKLESVGLKTTATEGGEPANQVGGKTLALRLLGQDQPGIVKDITTLLAEKGVGVEEFESHTSDAAMAGGTLFHASATLSLPADINSDQLEELLQDLSQSLMVDIELDDL